MTLEVQEKGVKVMKSKKRESKMWESKIIYDFKKKVSKYDTKIKVSLKEMEWLEVQNDTFDQFLSRRIDKVYVTK